jgi:cytochrome c oxidase subunit 2
MSLTACGGGGDKTGNETSNSNENAITKQVTTLNVTASNWRYNKDTYTVPAGKINIHFESKEVVHGFKIEGTDVDIQKNGTATVTLNSGTYMIHYDIPCGNGHQDMTAKLIVQ